MISINSKEPQIYYGSTPIKEVYKGSTKIYPSIDVQSIMDSIILWYDIKRQGATNENMAENPILRDLSGNGYDATCYNFAWTEESGISTTNYPNALVSDGVDDYAQLTGLPILTDYHLLSKEEVSYEIDSETLTLFKKVNNTEYSSVPLYYLLLFNRTLTQDEIEWVKKNLIEGNDDDVDWYGVEFYTTSPYPDCIRIGNPELHRTLPVHSQMKGCLLADDGTVNKYLNESDWTSETRDGSQGQVMVEMPKESYWKFETDGNIRRVKFSTKPLPGFKKTPQGYVSAYEASVQRSTNKLSSVVNTEADYRGGNNNAGWDGTYRSLLGRPATLISRTDFRTYARNRKEGGTEWNLMTYDMQKLLCWLFVVEYGTLNSQKTFNGNKDSNGYAQGGLGNGFTTLDYDMWIKYDNTNPIIKCGYTDEFGNGTGQKEYSMPSEYDATIKKLYVSRYRGVENLFGHIWQLTDGVNVFGTKVYVCSDPSKFNDTGYDGYTYVGDKALAESYVKELIFGDGGEIMPKVIGGSSTTYYCDNHYTLGNVGNLLAVLFGGMASVGANAGLFFANSHEFPSSTYTNTGSRLCFIPNNND